MPASSPPKPRSAKRLPDGGADDEMGPAGYRGRVTRRFVLDERPDEEAVPASLLLWSLDDLSLQESEHSAADPNKIGHIGR